MKKVISLILLMFIISGVQAKVIIVYKPDKTVSVIYPMQSSRRVSESNMDFLERVYKETTSGNELEGLPYDIVDESMVPDREDRHAWEGKAGEGITVNTVKASKKKKDEERLSKIKERADKNTMDIAEAELIAEGKIE